MEGVPGRDVHGGATAAADATAPLTPWRWRRGGGAAAVDFVELPSRCGAAAVGFFKPSSRCGAVAVDSFCRTIKKCMDLNRNSMSTSIKRYDLTNLVDY